jgi:hypothetical protein
MMQQTVDNKRQTEELVLRIKSLLDSLIDTPHDKDDGWLASHHYAEKENVRRQKFKK